MSVACAPVEGSKVLEVGGAVEPPPQPARTMANALMEAAIRARRMNTPALLGLRERVAAHVEGVGGAVCCSQAQRRTSGACDRESPI